MTDRCDRCGSPNITTYKSMMNPAKACKACGKIQKQHRELGTKIFHMIVNGKTVNIFSHYGIHDIPVGIK